MAMQVSIEGYDSFVQIGLGGMAAVYKARKISIDKVVAIKVLFPYLANDESFIERFQREAKSAARLQHENIVNVIDFGESDGAYFIVMEYYEGLDLGDLLKKHHHIPLDIAVLLLLEVCLGLEAAHDNNIIHRDIKPGNIICTRQGGVKIADFGLARNSETASVITQPGKVLGTPAFMSPEQAAGRDIGPPSDIFSLGVVAYELFCNKRPFEGDSYSEVLEKIQTFDPPPLAEINPLIQPDFDAIVQKMLVKNPDRRYQTTTDVIAELEEAMDKFQIPRDRRRLTRHIENPYEYQKTVNEKIISRCLSQGAFFLQKGKSHLEDAKKEFERILYLDPGNERAKKHLTRILAELGQTEKTVEVTQVTPVDGVKTSSHRAAGWIKEVDQNRADSIQDRWKRIAREKVWVVPVLVFVLLAAAFPFFSGNEPLKSLFGGTNTAPVLSAPSKLTVAEGQLVEFTIQAQDAEGTDVTFTVEGLPKGASLSKAGGFTWAVAYDQAGSHRIRFLANDGESVSSIETVIDAQDTPLALNIKNPGKQVVREGRELKIKLAAASPVGNPVTFNLDSGPEGMAIQGNRLVWKPKPGQTGSFTAKVSGTDGVASGSRAVEVQVKTTPTKKKPMPKPGRLSVYFLGGIGEFFLDGKLFEKQPPFTSAPVAAGRHTAGCKMSAGGSLKEFEIEVSSDKETIIEYEAGREPAVNQGGGS